MQLTYAIKYVADMDRAVAFHRDELGVDFTRPPTEMHGMNIAQIRDPDGADTSVSGPA